MSTKKPQSKKPSKPPRKIVVTDPEALQIIHAEAVSLGKTWAQTVASIVIRFNATRNIAAPASA